MESPSSKQFPELQRPDSLAVQAYRAIREYIASGELAPGEAITERSLAVRLGVSPTPVREALHRLEFEGLTKRRDRSKSSVVDHSPETIRQLMYIEVVLRAAQARFAAANMTDDDVAELEGIVDELKNAADGTDRANIVEIGRRFDLVIIRVADNQALQNMIDSVSIFGSVAKARALDDTRTGLAIQDHDVILDAFRRRDPAAAEAAVRGHLLTTADNLIKPRHEPASKAYPRGDKG
ncbi:GntR family transcriptional regulator [Amycolatopsis pigmentata]|uniref:GntR family transcriptional regulator n=1 Tax=Amycolatopsis pigmentata TaxID=450801 RepID=A0ABW5FPK3_9PSEU